jgi:hypothetical protein
MASAEALPIMEGSVSDSRSTVMEPHWGYEDGEVPVYEPCEDCGKILRADRLDLCWEHEALCTGELAVARVPLWRLLVATHRQAA